MAALHEALDRYRRTCESFRWEVPDGFNFGRDVVDRFGEEPERPALLWLIAEGFERRLRFSDVSRLSNQFAHLLTGLGISPGDPVILMLPRVPEWQVAVVGALKTGALVIPCSTILRGSILLVRRLITNSLHAFTAVFVGLGAPPLV